MGTAIPQFRRAGHQPWGAGLGPVPVALVGRTSTATMQDPVESIGRQIRIASSRLPEGFYIARYYWDVESGGIDLDLRSRTGIAGQYATAGIPRDGGMAELRAAVASGDPPFAAVICENIERCGRDMYDALRLEKELRGAGIPVFASDEPIDAQASEGSTILVRRMKQGVGEYFRYNLKTQMWGGLQQYVIAGFNTGRCPYGYAEDRSIHPNPMKASMGATRARLVIDPERGPWITRIFGWRVDEALSVPGIARRLTELGAPSPDGKAWSPGPSATSWPTRSTPGGWCSAAPRNTGPTRRKGERKIRRLPREYWTWAGDDNTHPRADRHGHLGGRPEDRAAARQRPQPAHPRPARPAYPFRTRIRYQQCDRRMHGSVRQGRKPGETYTYYCARPAPATPATPKTTPTTPGSRPRRRLHHRDIGVPGPVRLRLRPRCAARRPHPRPSGPGPGRSRPRRPSPSSSARLRPRWTASPPKSGSSPARPTRSVPRSATGSPPSSVTATTRASDRSRTPGHRGHPAARRTMTCP